ncbi:MAG: ABC transporter ATP-binding protein [Pirellulaceae bacterium]|nr:ABC transporter ATP-binding protein [Pirellulaceae bacterium]MDP7020422.1 ABC transporter ATP-binding protein [Pirellulaceae bacterium]
MTFAIHCRDLVKTYAGKPPVEAVRGIDLDVATGECLGVLGPNGAGKTTTIEILEGLLPPTSGDVQVLGRSWRQDPDGIRERIGISLQETILSEKQTVLETLALFRSFYRSGLEPIVALERVSLSEKQSAWIKHLSGGQKQRLAVAAALIGDPELLFLDEPTTGLDPVSRRQLWAVVQDFQARGRTVLLTTHYMEEAEYLCDRVAVVDQGRVIACGTPRELIASLSGDHVIEFAVDGGLDFVDWPLPTPTPQGDSYTMSVAKPHEVIPQLLERVQRSQGKLMHLTTRQASLEDVFLKLTGRRLDEDGES